MSMSHKGHQRF